MERADFCTETFDVRFEILSLKDTPDRADFAVEAFEAFFIDFFEVFEFCFRFLSECCWDVLLAFLVWDFSFFSSLFLSFFATRVSSRTQHSINNKIPIMTAIIIPTLKPVQRTNETNKLKSIES